jgi:serine/threonine protein phosphatase 1
MRVHARIDEDKVDCARPVEIYLGDYIDRGPDSAGVVSKLIERSRGARTIFLRGNHEQMLLELLEGNDCLGLWKAIGAATTLTSYDIEPGILEAGVSSIRRALSERLPAEHRQFFTATRSYCHTGPYLMVHAGLRPGIKLEDQTVSDLLCIRDEFLTFEGDFGFVVVHGHTPVMAPDFRRNRINIDTGAFATKRLTCLKIDQTGPRILSP